MELEKKNYKTEIQKKLFQKWFLIRNWKSRYSFYSQILFVIGCNNYSTIKYKYLIKEKARLITPNI